MHTDYTFSTPNFAYTLSPTPNGLVNIECNFREGLEEVLNSLELAGVDTESDLSNLYIDEDSDVDGTTFYFIELSHATLALYLTFEVLNYMGAPNYV